ncbi:MAG: STAS/SEC14 domain-containing protein [Vicinamibacterales bacterium]
MIQFVEGLGDNVIGVKLSGRLHDEDYDRFVPMVDQLTAEQGKVRMYVEMHDFHGWSAHALWDDINFAAQHSRDIERIAMVGEKTWQEWMAKICKPFTKATIKYFEAGEVDAARAWIGAA